jgi:hypothetical protein
MPSPISPTRSELRASPGAWLADDIALSAKSLLPLPILCQLGPDNVRFS